MGWYAVVYLITAWVLVPLVVILRGDRAVGFPDLFAASIAAAVPGTIVYMVLHAQP